MSHFLLYKMDKSTFRVVVRIKSMYMEDLECSNCLITFNQTLFEVGAITSISSSEMRKLRKLF